MKSLVFRTKNHVGNAAAQKRPDNAEHQCPDEADVHVHHRFRDIPCDQPDNQIPDHVKHTLPPCSAFYQILDR